VVVTSRGGGGGGGEQIGRVQKFKVGCDFKQKRKMLNGVTPHSSFLKDKVDTRTWGRWAEGRGRSRIG